MPVRRFALLALILCPLSAQIVPILGTDVVSASRTTINNNFNYLTSHIINVAGASNTVAEQVFITSGLGTGAWLTFPNCPDGSGVHLNYDTSNPGRWVCGTSGIYSLNGLTGGVQTFANDANVTVVSSGTTHTITWAGFLSLARGGGNANFSATGGAHFVVRQSGVGANFTVSQLASSDLSDVASIMFTTGPFVYGAYTSNFSGATHSIPWQVGTLAGIPGTCTVGEAYFATNAAAGQQIYECSAANTWTQQLNTGTIASLNGLTAAAQTFGNDTNVTVVSSGTTHTITWAGLLGLVRGGTNANLSATGGAHQVVRQSSLGAAFTVSQLQSSDLSDVANLLFNNASFTYGAFTADFSGSAHTLPWKVGSSGAMPGTCTIGEGYFATNAPIGQMIYQCSSTNTWTEENGGLSSLNGLNAATQTFTNDTNVTIVSGGSAHVITWAGFLGLARGGSNANLSATGGAHQVVRQSNTGAAFTVSQLASTDLSDVANILFNNSSFTYGAFTANFSGAAHSIPWQVGPIANLPATCTIGEGYFATNAQPGQQIYECSGPAANTWTQQLNSGGVVSLNGLVAPSQTFGNDTNVTVVSSGTTHTITWAGLLGLARGGGNANFSATGGAHYVVRQSSAGAAFTVSQLQSSDLVDVANLMYTTAPFVYGPYTSNFAGAAHSIPWQVGTFASKPPACTVGEAYFATDATAGQQIYECSVANTWTQQVAGGAGSLAIDVGGSTVASRPALNLITSTGMTESCADNPSFNRVDCTPSVNTAVMAGIASLQQGDLLTAFSTNGTTSYVASPAAGCSATVLKSGALAWIIVDTASTGTASLNYCNQGVKNIKKSDGVTDPGATITAGLPGAQYVFDGTLWRQAGGSGGGMVYPAAGIAVSTGTAWGASPFAMGANTSIFTTTTALAQIFAWKNTTAATSGTSQGSPVPAICGRSWHGGADTEDCITLGDLPGNGTDAAIIFAIGHTGASTGTVTTTLPGPVQIGASAPACAGGTASAWCANEGTAVTAASSVGQAYFNSTTHEETLRKNGGGDSMVPSVRPSPIHSTGLTGNVTTATLCSASAGNCDQAGQYHIHWDIIETGTACATVSPNGSVTLQLTYTDTNATAHTITPLMMGEAISAGTPAMSQSFFFQTTLANAWSSGDLNISSNGSVMQYATTYVACSSGTGTYQLDLAVTRVQ